MARTGRPRTVDLPMDELRTLTEQGWRAGALAKRYGCSKQTICDRMKEAGIPRHPQHSCPGEHNPAWKGGRYLDDDGYVMIYAPDHPLADCNRRVREHRLVMEAVLGRYLLPNEVVDHIDGDRQHNAPSNLRVFQRNSDHLKATLTGRCPNWSAEGRERTLQGCRRARGSRRKSNQSASGADAPPSP